MAVCVRGAYCFFTRGGGVAEKHWATLDIKPYIAKQISVKGLLYSYIVNVQSIVN